LVGDGQDPAIAGGQHLGLAVTAALPDRPDGVDHVSDRRRRTTPSPHHSARPDETTRRSIAERERLVSVSNDPIRDVLFPSDDPTVALTSDLAAQRLGLERSLKEFSQSGRFANSRDQDEREARSDLLRQLVESNRELTDVVIAHGQATNAGWDEAHRKLLLWTRAAVGAAVLGAVVAMVLAVWF
jgi:hypothetical protein